MINFNLDDCYMVVDSIVNYIAFFCDFNNYTINSFYNRFPRIDVSDEKPVDVYEGRYKDKHIAKIIRNNIPQDERAAEYCKRLQKELSIAKKEQSKELFDELINALKRMLEDTNKYDKRLSPFDEDKIKRIIDAFKEREFVSLVLGRYYYKRRMIVLYRQNIMDSAENNNAFDNMRRVLTHEMFHAIHHFIFDDAKQYLSKFGKKGYGSVVKEGLARLVEYNYCKDELNGEYCKGLEESWNSHFFEVYPYSAAKYLEEYTRNHKDKATLIHRLLTDSKPNFINAYHDIVYLYKLSNGFDKVLEDDKYNVYREYYTHSISSKKKRYLIEYLVNNQKNVLDLITSDVRNEIRINQKDFSDLLYKKISERKLKNKKLYEEARLNKDVFYKTLRGETDPKPETVSQLAIALKLNSEEYEEFINAAGYSRKYTETDPLSIVGVYIDHKEYDWDDIESAFVELTGHTLVNYKGRKDSVFLD